MTARHSPRRASTRTLPSGLLVRLAFPRTRTAAEKRVKHNELVRPPSACPDQSAHRKLTRSSVHIRELRPVDRFPRRDRRSRIAVRIRGARPRRDRQNGHRHRKNHPEPKCEPIRFLCHVCLLASDVAGGIGRQQRHAAQPRVDHDLVDGRCHDFPCEPAGKAIG